MALIDNNAQGFVLHFESIDQTGGLYAAYLYADTEDLTLTMEIGSIVWTPDNGAIWAGGQANAIANRLNALDPRVHFFYVIIGSGIGDGYQFFFTNNEDFNFRIGAPSGGGSPPPLDPPSAPYPDPVAADTGSLIEKRKREVPVGSAQNGQGQSGVIPVSAKRPKRVIV